MTFCKCGTILTAKDGKLYCSSCDIFFKGSSSISEKPKQKEIRILDDKNRLAVHEHICSKCGYDKAELIDQGIWYSDEDNVILFKCGKCGFVERGEGKVT